MRPDELKAWGDAQCRLAERGDWDGYLDRLGRCTGDDQMRYELTLLASRDAPTERPPFHTSVDWTRAR